MKVALYARVSTEQQIDNYSIPLQRERLEAFCTSKGWTHTQEYIDAGYSGSNLNRPALQQLQKDIKNKKINMVIVYRLDRLEAKGYGESVPKAINKRMAKNYDFLNEGDVLTEEFIERMTPEQQEIADQINRRTEFKVLRTNYNLF